jgi:hypothetical protein
MFDIVQQAPSDEFKNAWLVAARHLIPLGGASLKWLRADLTPPLAEHLSFLIGNQIFFVFVEAAEFQYARANELFMNVAKAANAVPCIMPMKKNLAIYEPALSGWGLVHAQTKDPVNPPDLVSDQLIEMTDWELHNFAVQFVKSQLTEQGKDVFSAQSGYEIDPSIWYEDEGEAYWVVVREARAPAKGAAKPANLGIIAEGCSSRGNAGFFASVLVANADDPFDPAAQTNGNFLPLYRGHGMAVEYDGLQEVD